MGQKVQVICAIAHEPEFVVLDEPFSGLDPVNQQVLEKLIRDLAQLGSTVLFSTHVMQHAERLCDRMLLIAKGRKIFDGTIAGAKATIPRRVLISTESSIDPLAGLDGVAEIKPLGESPTTSRHEGLGDPAARARRARRQFSRGASRAASCCAGSITPSRACTMLSWRWSAPKPA